MDICLTINPLPDFSFISLISESEADVELHPKLKLRNILKYKQRFFKISFMAMLLHMPVCVLVH